MPLRYLPLTVVSVALVTVLLTGCPLRHPTAAFMAAPLAGPSPLVVYFMDQSTGGPSPITRWWWSFGDGETSTDQNPTHTYTTPGAYSVSLTVTTSVASDTAAKPAYITVTEPAAEGEGEGEPDGAFVVLGYNDLGMHCMNEDFSELMILPPYNTLHAQVIDRRGEDPSIATADVTVSYTVPTNTTSVEKTNFWQYAEALLGVVLDPDVGLTGNGLSGTMTPTGDNDWSVTGIPITPMNDLGEEDPYPLATITVTRDGTLAARTRAVVPVSWEISCSLCHTGTGISTATHILRAHDALHDTGLESQKPVMCGSCHAQAPLGTTGSPSLSRAMHHAHASRMSAAPLDVDCYACHPGVHTQCLRDVHFSAGLECQDCHGSMSDVGDTARSPWVDEPRCGACHQRQGFEFEQAGTLYRNSKGHHGVHCAACHGSPHAITPTVTAADNVQALDLQGHTGVIDTCTVCHSEQPDDPFGHQLEDDEGED